MRQRKGWMQKEEGRDKTDEEDGGREEGIKEIKIDL